MSSKSSIYLTKDNEHGYIEVNEENFPIYLQFDINNIEVETYIEDEAISIKLKPDTEIYDIFLKAFKKEGK